MQSERVDQEPVLAAGDQHREVTRDALVEVEHHGHPERRGQLDPCLAFVGRWIHGGLRGRVIIARYRKGRIDVAQQTSTTLNFGPWYRRSPFFEATLRAGCSAYDI